MIPIPVFWTQYTATMTGRALKVVPCENCSTEYLYVLQRESSGVGTSMYAVDSKGAAGHAESSAAETLKSVLENDFDPVPCPACGHYQRYMFPKLVESRWVWIQSLMMLAILLGCLAAGLALFRSVTYFQRPDDHTFGNMIRAWAALLIVCLIGLGLSLLRKFKIRRFDPNREDLQARLAVGRRRAVTRAEFEKDQRKDKRG
jgi:hypothetical protein